MIVRVTVFLFCATMFSLQALPSGAQTFSCPAGRQPACVGYGDQIVDQSAACFAKSQCSSEGFVCKSNLTTCAADYDELEGGYNALVDKHNALISDYNTLVDSVAMRDAMLSDVGRCIDLATTLDEVRRCSDLVLP